MRLLIRWGITILAILAAANLVPGIRVEGNAWIVLAAVAVILGFVNAIVRPILKFFSFPFIVLSLGLFVFVINALMLWLASYLAINIFNLGFFIDGFWAAFFGSLIISAVSVVLSSIFKDRND